MAYETEPRDSAASAVESMIAASFAQPDIALGAVPIGVVSAERV